MPAMTQLRALSSELFLTLHDPFTGKPEVSQELLEFGVTAAQFADLIISTRLDVDSDDHVVLGRVRADAAADPIGQYVVGSVGEQPRTYPARTWVASPELAAAVTDLVVQELVTSGVLRHERVRRLRGRKEDRYPANDLLAASHSRNRVRNMLINPQTIDLRNGTLAVLVGALRAEHVFDAPHAQQIIGELKRRTIPQLQSVVEALETAVAAASLAMGGGRR
jgi:Golgi phosphoprotein 3 GPP34